MASFCASVNAKGVAMKVRTIARGGCRGVSGEAASPGLARCAFWARSLPCEQLDGA